MVSVAPPLHIAGPSGRFLRGELTARRIVICADAMYVRDSVPAGLMIRNVGRSARFLFFKENQR